VSDKILRANLTLSQGEMFASVRMPNALSTFPSRIKHTAWHAFAALSCPTHVKISSQVSNGHAQSKNALKGTGIPFLTEGV
jgi:hypothetical protein